MSEKSPFHAGEQAVQSRLGVRDAIEPWARRVVRPYLPEEHQAFYAQLPYLVVAARDEEERPWVTLLTGEPGFVSSPDSGTLRIDALPAPGDALSGSLEAGDDIGLLGIELHTRRRNRVNGSVASRDASGLELLVDQSFGNCPQYITDRGWHGEAAHESGPVSRTSSLSSAHRELVQRSDTFFIASGYRGEGESATFGMDASHRGGSPGFVQVNGDRRLSFPDYAGNNHFNTIGNLLLDPRAGLLFVDFERGDLLQLTGRTVIDWDSPEVARFSGARRLVHFEIEQVVFLERALPIRWDATGTARRELRVVAKQPESADVTSFLLSSRDGGPLPEFSPGQHLPVSLDIPGISGAVERTYSLSAPPDPTGYRITVKRDPDGLVSSHLHDHVEVGDVILSGSPQGSFTLDATSGRPIVLVSAGVGLTPLVSMLRTLALDPDRRVLFIHGARDGAHHPLRDEIEDLAARAPHLRTHTAYSRPRPEDQSGRDYQSAGRIDVKLLEQLLPELEGADFYLCGPVSFMSEIERELEARGVPRDQIHSESFGPAGAA